MKKVMTLLVAVAVAFALVSCATTSDKPADAKPAAAKPAEAKPAEAKPAADTPAVLVVADFEAQKDVFDVYNGPNSTKPTIAYVADQVHGGKSAVKVTMKCTDWSGAVLKLEGAPADWTTYKTLHMWAFGTASKQGYFVDIEEAAGELFRVYLTDDTAGWKEIVVNLADIKKRSDYQDGNAKINGKLEFPLKTIQFMTASNFTGSMIFDDITLTK